VIERVKSHRYDIVYMDVQMPEMDGLLATCWIRANGAYQPYIISMTANSSGEDRERCMEAGMDDFIPKPFDLGRIRESLIKWHLSRISRTDHAA
jgi:CheY-like chemotaxis protein